MFSMNKQSGSVTDMIRFDHTHVLATFHQYTTTTRAGARKALADAICDAIEIHATLEEEVFYPVLRRLNGNEPMIQKSEPEHDEMRRMIDALRATATLDERRDGMLHELMRDVMHHVADEETVLLPEAERLLGKERLVELGAAMAQRRVELLKSKAGKVATAGFSGSTAALVVGLAGALMAARLVTRKTPELGSRPA
jgi:hemerythrin superfamily protein